MLWVIVRDVNFDFNFLFYDVIMLEIDLVMIQFEVFVYEELFIWDWINEVVKLNLLFFFIKVDFEVFVVDYGLIKFVGEIDK